jgi:hypothetical protein
MVLDVMSGVLFVYVVEGVDNKILDGRNRLKVVNIRSVFEVSVWGSDVYLTNQASDGAH